MQSCITLLVISCGKAQDFNTAVEFECTHAIWQYGTIDEVARAYICPIGLD